MPETREMPPVAEPLLTLVKLREAHVRLMQDYGDFDDAPTAAFLDRIADFQARAAAAGANIAGPDERFEVQSTINYWQTVRINAGQRPQTVLLGDFDHEAAVRAAGETPPYKGLAPFQTSDNAFFSGRYDLVRAMVAMVKAHRLLALTGLSGSGKSSAVRAGLIPDLAAGADDCGDDNASTDSSSWHYPAPILPGADPLAALEAVYGPINAAADLPAALDRAGTTVLLAIDQLEEVFTLCDEEDPRACDRRDRFLDALVAAATAGTHRHVIVITMRSEFDVNVQKHAAFGKLFNDGRIVIEAMSPADLRKAIEEPAKRLGVNFDPGLIDELMSRVQGEPAGLPLLQFTLLELWKRRDGGGPMRTADYEALGGNPRIILARRADEIFAGMLPEKQNQVKNIFMRLVEIEKLEATSRRIKRSDLDSLGGNIVDALALLVDNGLVRASPAGAITPATDIEIAHEALIRNWQRLTDWVKESYGEQVNRKAFANRAEQWEENKGGDLLVGMALDQASKFWALTPTETRFIAASTLAARLHERRRTRVTIALALLSLLLIIAIALLTRAWLADRQTTRSEALFDVADQLIERGDLTLANRVMLAALGSSTAPPPRMRAALEAATLSEPRTDVLTRGSGKTRGTSFAASGGALATIENDGRVQLWQQTPDFDWVSRMIEVPERQIMVFAMAPDGTSAFSASAPRGVKDPVATQTEHWSFDPGTTDSAPIFTVTQRKVAPESGGIASLAWSADGKRVVSATRDGLIMLFNGANGALLNPNLLAEEAGNTQFTTAIFSPDGETILTGDENGFAQLVNVAIGKSPDLIDVSPVSVTSLGFTKSGNRFAAGSNDGIVRIYTRTGEKAFQLSGHRKAVTSLAFAPDGGSMISGSADGTMRLWEMGVTSGRLLRTWPISGAGRRPVGVDSVAFAETGEAIAIGSADGAVRVLSLNGDKLADEKQLIDSGDVLITTISQNNRIMVVERETAKKGSGSDGAVVEAWDIATGRVGASIPTNGAALDHSLSLDGARMAFTAIDGSGVHLTIASTATNTTLFRESLPEGKYYSAIVMSGDGQMLVAVLNSGEVRRWTKGAGMADLVLGKNSPLVQQAGLSLGAAMLGLPRGGTPRFSLTDGSSLLSVFDARSGAVLANIRASSDIALVRWSPDGTLIFTGYETGSGEIWDARTGKLKARLAGRHDNGVSYAHFSEDGTMLVTTSVDATARLWRVADGAVLHVLRGHQASVVEAGFSNDGRRVMTSAEDRSVMIWDVETGKRLTTLRGPAKSGEIRGWFSADGKQAFTLSDDTTRRTWNIGTAAFDYRALVAAACASGGSFSADDIQRYNLKSTAIAACPKAATNRPAAP